jgi:hypothetical protein
MKFHVVAASDIIQKGLDLSYPHNTLGQDGLLEPLPVNEVLVPAIIFPAPQSIQDTIADTEISENPTEAPVPVEPSVLPVVESDTPIQEERKPGRKSKKL